MVGRRDTANDDDAVPTIQQLLTTAIDNRKQSVTDIAKAMGVTRQQVYKIKDGAVKSWPNVSNVEPIARVLGVPPTTVLLAYAKSFGIPVRQTGSRLATVLPPAAEHLTAKQVAAVLEVIEAMVTPERETKATVTPLPRKRQPAPPPASKAARKVNTPRAEPQDSP